MARDGLAPRGVVSFHGGLGAAKPAIAGAIKARILVYTGGNDRSVTPTAVAAFEEEMANAGAKAEVVTIPGAKQSWEGMQEFFTEPFAARGQ